MQCPQCQAMVPLGSTVCVYCHAEVSVPVTPVSATRSSLPAESTHTSDGASGASPKSAPSPQLAISAQRPRKLSERFSSASPQSSGSTVPNLAAPALESSAPINSSTQASPNQAPSTQASPTSDTYNEELSAELNPELFAQRGPLQRFIESQALLEGKFKLQDEIGRGGMGFVYRAIDQSLGREVAIKILPPHYNDDVSIVGRFQREARAMASLDHPNIVTVYGIGYEHGLHYFSMKLLRGETLAHLNKRVELGLKEASDLSQVIDLMIQACNGLEHAHAKQLLHRDIKPGNLMLSPSGALTVMDFGIVKDLGDSDSLGLKTAHGKIFGTPEYMPPEQAMGKGNYSPASDLYALAVVGYELLCGELPYTADTPIGIIIQHIRGEIPPLRGRGVGLPASVEALFKRALAKDPLERYQSANELREALSMVRQAILKPSIQEVNPLDTDLVELDLFDDIATYEDLDLEPTQLEPPQAPALTPPVATPPVVTPHRPTPPALTPPPLPTPPLPTPSSAIPQRAQPNLSTTPVMGASTSDSTTRNPAPPQAAAISLERASKRSGHYKMPRLKRGK